jgi:hypothetical protein
MPRKVFTAGEVLTSADVNTYLMDQTIMTFAGTAARGSAIGTATEGMVTYLADSDSFEFWDGSSYQPLASGIDGFLVEYVVIAGGGGGGSSSPDGGARGGGGGGAGGYRSNVTGENSGGGQAFTLQNQYVISTGVNYSVEIGAGGTGNGLNGNASFFGIVSPIGGGAGGRETVAGRTGGSGGGAGQAGSNTTGGSGTTNQGFSGGNVTGDFGNGGAGAGGGGAGGAAANVGANASTGGAGGVGVASSITGTSVTRAVGGQGGNWTGGANGTAGGANTGTGGQGGGGNSGAGGAGGSGVVILKYSSTYTITIGAGLTGSTSTSGSNKITTITAGTGNVSWA